MKQRYASAKTVNHSLQWTTAEGVTTNLGEVYNGPIKGLGRQLRIWKGKSPKTDTDQRWQELAWRINEDIHVTSVKSWVQVSHCS